MCDLFSCFWLGNRNLDDAKIAMVQRYYRSNHKDNYRILRSCFEGCHRAQTLLNPDNKIELAHVSPSYSRPTSGEDWIDDVIFSLGLAGTSQNIHDWVSKPRTKTTALLLSDIYQSTGIPRLVVAFRSHPRWWWIEAHRITEKIILLSFHRTLFFKASTLQAAMISRIYRKQDLSNSCPTLSEDYHFYLLMYACM